MLNRITSSLRQRRHTALRMNLHALPLHVAMAVCQLSTQYHAFKRFRCMWEQHLLHPATVILLPNISLSLVNRVRLSWISTRVKYMWSSYNKRIHKTAGELTRDGSALEEVGQTLTLVLSWWWLWAITFSRDCCVSLTTTSVKYTTNTDTHSQWVRCHRTDSELRDIIRYHTDCAPDML